MPICLDMQRTMLTSEQRSDLEAVMHKRHGNAALVRRALIPFRRKA